MNLPRGHPVGSHRLQVGEKLAYLLDVFLPTYIWAGWVINPFTKYQQDIPASPNLKQTGEVSILISSSTASCHL